MLPLKQNYHTQLRSYSGGAKGMVDAFVHQESLIWKDRKHKESTRYGRKGKPGKEEKGKWKGKRKHQEENFVVEDSEPGTYGKIGSMYAEVEWRANESD